MIDEYPPKALSDEHISAIGALVVAVSRIDSLLTDIIAGLMHTDILSAVVAVHHQQISSKVDTLKALANLGLGAGAEDDFPPIFKLFNDVKRVADERNTIVHCSWATDDGTPLAVRFSARGKLNRSRRPYGPKQILSLAAEANALLPELARMRAHFPARPIAQNPRG
jgi:hypothetical protein